MKKFTSLLCFTGLFLLLSVMACNQVGRETGHHNPFDPDNDEIDDPYNLRAGIGGGGIRLTWNAIIDPEPEGYNLYRMVNDTAFVKYIELGNVSSYVDTGVVNGYAYEYYLVARVEEGEADTSNIVAIRINTHPFFVIEGDSVEYTPTRYIELTILAFGADNMLISNFEDFEGSTWENYATAKNWALETGQETKTVYLKVAYADGDTSEIMRKSIDPAALEPSVIINNGAEFSETRYVTLTLQATGADSMVVSNQPLNSATFTGGNTEKARRPVKELVKTVAADTTEDTLTWIPFPEDGEMPWTLETESGRKTVYVRFRNDFLMQADAVASVSPMHINPRVIINDGAKAAPALSVTLSLPAAGATHIKISNHPFEDDTVSGCFNAAKPGGIHAGSLIASLQSRSQDDDGWIPYAKSVPWELEPGLERKKVYVRFRNDFLIEEEAHRAVNPARIVPSLTILPEDSEYINHRDVLLSMPDAGASKVLIANSPDSTGIEWQAYREKLPHRLSEGDGWKHVYAWFRNDFYSIEMESDSIGLKTEVEVDTFYWSSTGGDTLVPGDEITFILVMADHILGPEWAGQAVVAVEGWEPVQLESLGDGNYIATLTLTPLTAEISEGVATVSFTDWIGNIAPETEASRTITFLLLTGCEHDFPLGLTGETITMIHIRSGVFVMGSFPADPASNDSERPRHIVTIDYSFWIGKYETTQAQWEAVTGSNPSYFPDPIHPVEQVTWNEVQGFLADLNSQVESEPWRMPTESEWEYVCRAGTNTRFHWGDDPEYEMLGNYAWYIDNYDGGTQPVGQKLPNPWGLYDLHGNIAEYCEDDHSKNYFWVPNDGSANVDDPRASSRVARGGSYAYNAEDCRAASRRAVIPSHRHRNFGFRLVKSTH